MIFFPTKHLDSTRILKSATLRQCAQVALLGVLSCMTMAANAQSTDRPLRLVLGGGLTGGGDKLVTVDYVDRPSESIHAGGLVHLYVGAEYRFTQKVSAQVNVGYHVSDITPADNGSLTFSRVPVEVLGHYAVTPQWRLGGGLRFVDSIELEGTGILRGSEQFKPSTGLVLEAEYMMTPSAGIKIRGTSERYTSKAYGDSVSGNHVGVYASFYL